MAKSEKYKSLVAETTRFLAVGFISFLIDYITFLIFNRLVFNQSSDVHTPLTSVSNIIGYSVGVLANYILIRLFVFTAEHQKANGKGAKPFIIFIVASLIGLLLTDIFTKMFMSLFETLDFSRFNMLMLHPDSLGKISATFLVTIWNYFSKKMFIFK